MKLCTFQDFENIMMYQYNVFTWEDFYNTKYFKDKYHIGNLKKFFGVKTKDEAMARVKELVEDFMKELIDHLLTSGYTHLNNAMRMYINEPEPEMRFVIGVRGVRVRVHPRTWLKERAKKHYEFIPEGILLDKIINCFDEQTGITWNLPLNQSLIKSRPYIRIKPLMPRKSKSGVRMP